MDIIIALHTCVDCPSSPTFAGLPSMSTLSFKQLIKQRSVGTTFLVLQGCLGICPWRTSGVPRRSCGKAAWRSMAEIFRQDFWWLRSSFMTWSLFPSDSLCIRAWRNVYLATLLKTPQQFYFRPWYLPTKVVHGSTNMCKWQSFEIPYLPIFTHRLQQICSPSPDLEVSLEGLPTTIFSPSMCATSQSKSSRVGIAWPSATCLSTLSEPISAISAFKTAMRLSYFSSRDSGKWDQLIWKNPQ